MAQGTITVDVSLLRRWASAVSSEAEDMTRKYINLALKNSANIVQRQEAKEVPRGITGKLAGSLRQLVTEVSATIGPDPALDYPLYVHDGTKPHMPPVASIQAWADAKGINPWALAMSIKKKGTKANPFVPRTFDTIQDPVAQEFQTVTRSIANFLMEV